MNQKTKRCVYLAVIVVCLAVILWSGHSLLSTLSEYRHGDADIQKVYQLMEVEDDGGEDGQQGALALTEEEKDEDARLAAYRKLKEDNGDLVGWVRIEGTVIDYPVMQTVNDPDYYLHRGFDREYSTYGMIYMDATCDLKGECPNYVLYGHHMRNGSMFARLDDYKNKEFYEEHPVIGFDTLDEVGSYEVAGVIHLPASEIDLDFLGLLAARSEEDYGRFIEYVKENAYYETGITPVWPEQLLTLSTCEYSVKDGRLLVIARKIPEDQEKAAAGMAPEAQGEAIAGGQRKVSGQRLP